ncbi:TRAP transporter substrate-binding protein [Bacillus sp. B15-48]|uniref:TRAP transporter substrate-binding protein n=1 Tax=Bacillus sp. B15-48 TaxID=1548601 RepID=UPI00193EF9C3|nr:TRAP transporter substrate-binding protein [Bacillus sp. B15-48]
MHFRNKIGRLFLLFLILTVITACSNTSGSSSSTANDENNKEIKTGDKTVNIAFSLYSSENDLYSVTFREWAEKVEEETEGRVKFTPYYSGQLSSLFDTLDSVKSGTVDGGLLSAGASSGQIDAVSLLEPLGVFRSEEDFKEFYEDSLSVMMDIFQENGVELSFWTVSNTQSLIVHPDKFITNPDQMKGMKIRTAGRWQAEQAEALGAAPVTMDPGELYLALQNKTVDTTVQTVNLTESFKLYEVAPKMSLANISANANMFILNSKVWDSISDEDKEVIRNISINVGLESYSTYAELEETILDRMAENGAEINPLTKEEEDNFLEIYNSITPKIVENVGDQGKELNEILKNYR